MKRLVFYGKGPIASGCRAYLPYEQMQVLRLCYNSKYRPKIGVCVQYDRIIPQPEIDTFEFGIINFHPAPLPEYRGRNVFAHAILNKETRWCVTAHYMTGQVDAGPIIGTEPVIIYEDDTAESLYWHSIHALYRLFGRVIVAAATHATKLPAILQNEYFAHTYRKDSLASLHDCTGLSGDELHRRVRALTFPGKPKPYIVVGDHKYELTLKEDT